MGFRNKRTGRSMRLEMAQMQRDMTRLLNHDIPDEAESKLLELGHASFDKEQFQDGTAQKKWKSRKGEPNEARKKRRAILVKTGEGRRDMQTFRLRRTVGIGFDTKYMPVHNEGLRAGRKPGFTMPKRQIISKPGTENKALTRHMKQFVTKRMDKIHN